MTPGGMTPAAAVPIVGGGPSATPFRDRLNINSAIDGEAMMENIAYVIIIFKLS